MRKILLVAAIYSLIVNQCCKNAQRSLYSPGNKEKITGVGVLSGQVYEEHTLLRRFSYKNATFITSSNPKSYARAGGKE